MPEQKEWRVLQVVLMLADLTGVVAAGWLATRLLGHGSVAEGQDAWLLLGIAVVLAAIFAGHGLYDPQQLLGGTREYATVFRACAYGLGVTVLIGFVMSRPISRGWVLVATATATAFLEGTRFGIRRVAYRLRARGYFVRRAIVVGADASSLAIADQLGSPEGGMCVVGFLDDYMPAGSRLPGGLAVLGPSAALAAVAARTKAQYAIVVPQALPWESLQRLLTSSASSPNGLRLQLSAGFYDLLTTGVRLLERNHVPLLAVNKARLTPFETVIKAALDYGVSMALLIAFAPLLAVTVAWQSIRVGRPLLERRRVLGRSGKAFDLLSFRSSAPFGSDILQKLPGLLNVLTRNLSLVGPQPLSQDNPALSERWPTSSAIQPGLTGPWRHVDDPDAQAVLDLYYIRSYSVWLDVQVLFSRVRHRLGMGSPVPRAFRRLGRPAAESPTLSTLPAKGQP